MKLQTLRFRQFASHMTSWDFSHFLPSTRWRREHIFQSVGLTTVPQQLGKAPIEARQKNRGSVLNQPFGAWINRFHFFLLLAYAAANADANSVFAKRKHHECPTKSGPINCQNEKLSFSRPAFWNCGQLWPPHRPRVGRGLHEDHELIRRTAQADTLSTSMKLCPIMVSADRRPTWNTRSDLWTA